MGILFIVGVDCLRRSMLRLYGETFTAHAITAGAMFTSMFGSTSPLRDRDGNLTDKREYG